MGTQQEPLRDELIYRAGDTSIDTTHNEIQDEADLSEPREVKAIWGEIGLDTQGPAGAPIPDLDDQIKPEFEDMTDAEYRYTADPDAPEDAAGPVPLTGEMDISLEELNQNPAAETAAEVAELVHRSNTVEMLDVMQDAEEEFNAAHQGTESTPEDLHIEHHATQASSALRQKVVERIARALGMNPQFVGDAAVAAAEIEEKVFNSTRSATVYQSVASNAIRVAGQAVDLPEVIRIALGEPKGLISG